MREMRAHIVTEGWRKKDSVLRFSEKQIVCFASPKKPAEGFFTITAPGGAEGFVRSSDERMQCLPSFFCGSEEQVNYCFQTEGMQEGEIRSGSFFVVSDCGEYELPWKVTVREAEAESSVGEIRNLFHFANLARTSWEEAVAFFYTDACRRICRQEGVSELYRGLSVYAGNEANVEAFLVAVNKKQPIAFSAVRKEIRIPELQGSVREEILIVKNGWGPVQLSVETQGEFLRAEKTRLGEDDFLGNQCRVSVYLDEAQMHAGKNYGRVTFGCVHGSFSVDILAQKHSAQAGGQDIRRRELKKCNARMVKLYQQFRMKKLDMATWRAEAGECIEQMTRLAERSVVPRLFHAQLLMAENRMEEAGWFLEHIRQKIEEAEPAVLCYYLYLTTLYNREEAYGKETTRRIVDCYRKNPQEWRIAWLLLFLSRELNRSVTKKWEFLRLQFEKGCTSPVLYLEALQLFGASPMLLSRLDGIEKRILLYGAKNGLLGRDLMEHVRYLVNREKYYDPTLCRIMQLSWEKCQDTETLQAICTLLVKGGKTGTEYGTWYRMGVTHALRITLLYEHYLMSIDQEKETEIPRNVLLYFAYQSNLDDDSAAWLYAYVEAHRQQDPDLYLAYRPQMESFVSEQIAKGKVSRSLAFLYSRLLTGKDTAAESRQRLAALSDSVEVRYTGNAKKLAVVHARLAQESVYTVTDGRAYVMLYDEQDRIFAEDEAKNRWPAEAKAVLTPLFPDRMSAVYAGDCLAYHLRMTDAVRPVVTAENAGSCLALLKEPGLRKDYARQLYGGLISFYFETDRTKELDALLEAVTAEQIAPQDRENVVRCLVLEGFYEKAYSWQQGMDFLHQDARILMQLCGHLLALSAHTQEERMTRMCFAATVGGKYNEAVLQQLTEHYEGSIRELEELKAEAEGFGINTFPLCERLMEQLLFTGGDVTERTDLLRQYVREGGSAGLKRAFLHRAACSCVQDGQPIHRQMISEMLRMEQNREDVTDMCRIACLQYYAKNRAAMEKKTEAAVRGMGEKLLAENKILPVLRDLADLIPGAEQLLDKTFVVYQGTAEKKAVLHYRILTPQETEGDYRSMEMLHVYEGIYVGIFILFPGENLQYYISELPKTDKIADSGMKKAAECSAAEQGRYGMLSAVALAQLAAEKQSEGQSGSIELLNQYLHTEYCVGALFAPLREGRV